MKRIFLVIFTFLSINLYSQTKADSIVYWNKNTRLKWNDFKGKTPESVGYESASSFIEIHAKGIWKHHIPHYKVTVLFIKSKSWAKDTSGPLLDHEQLHFDIGELYAREIRKSLMELKKQGDTVMKDYSQVLHAYYRGCKKYNILYDNETDHGIYNREQKEWENLVAKELTHLKKYNTP